LVILRAKLMVEIGVGIEIYVLKENAVRSCVFVRVLKLLVKEVIYDE